MTDEQNVMNTDKRFLSGSTSAANLAPTTGFGISLLRQKELEAKYPEGTSVPKPPHWGGFLLRPTAIEFWQVSKSRVKLKILTLTLLSPWRSLHKGLTVCS
jgi:hypothetical protein